MCLGRFGSGSCLEIVYIWGTGFRAKKIWEPKKPRSVRGKGRKGKRGEEEGKRGGENKICEAPKIYIKSVSKQKRGEGGVIRNHKNEGAK